jgi:hypothetical protein
MPEAAKFCNHRALSLIANAAKMVARISWRRIERKVEVVLGEDQFGLRKRKGTKDAIGMMRIISERTLDRDEDLRK